MPAEPPRQLCLHCLGYGEVLVFQTPPGGTTRPVFAPCPKCGDDKRKPSPRPTTR